MLPSADFKSPNLPTLLKTRNSFSNSRKYKSRFLTGLTCLLVSSTAMAQSKETEPAIDRNAMLLPGVDAVVVPAAELEHFCSSEIITIPEHLAKSIGKDSSSQEIEFEADQIDLTDGNIYTLKGNAEVVQGAQGIFADSLSYDQQNYQASAKGEVKFYSAQGDTIFSDRLTLEIGTRIGEAEGVQFTMSKRDIEETVLVTKDEARRLKTLGAAGIEFVVPNTISAKEDGDQVVLKLDETSQAVYQNKKTKIGRVKQKRVRMSVRGEADRLFFEGYQRERLENVAITTCRTGQDDVFIRAREMTLDHSTGIGRASGLKVSLFNVPIFYLPQATFPINDERKTGFLFPTVGYEKESGYIASIPYYINIAPTQDATITPRVLTQRGVQLIGEYRYLGDGYDGILSAEVLPSDAVFEDDRWALHYQHDTQFAENWEASIDTQSASDNQYFEDFENDINLTSATLLPQKAEIAYVGRTVDFSAGVLGYENVDDLLPEASEPYGQLPRVTFGLDSQHNFRPFKYELETEVVNFDHASRVNGVRSSLEPSVSISLEELYGFIKPKLSVTHIQYSLDKQDAGLPDSPSVTVPVFSVDSGLFYERDATWQGEDYYQTLEPRILYVYAPEKDQSELPIFDTSESDFNNYSNLFNRKRFFGGDRVGDTNQLSIGVTTRLIDEETGTQKLSAGMGAIVYLSDRKITASGEAEDATTSDFAGEITASLTRDWDANAFLQWDREEGDLSSGRFGISYNPDSRLYENNQDHRRYFSLGYLFQAGGNSETEARPKDVTELDLSFRWPVSDRLRFKFEEQYSLEDREHRNTEIGIGYNACCWAVWLSGQRRVQDSTATGDEFKNAIFLTLEIDQLGKIGGGL